MIFSFWSLVISVCEIDSIIQKQITNHRSPIVKLFRVQSPN